jgi:hypothetical protein
MRDNHTYERTVGLTLFGVIVFLSWPIWGMMVAAARTWTWTAAATGLLPLGLTLLWVGLATGIVGHAVAAYERGIHGMADHLHGGTHRHV